MQSAVCPSTQAKKLKTRMHPIRQPNAYLKPTYQTAGVFVVLQSGIALDRSPDGRWRTRCVGRVASIGELMCHP
ncbi:hypothetical protein [Crenothrix sp.]|uniref:hypothetical protein n=1 Tax=Crenothrix sp. TaxID=3100433 RepID=UPI00374CA722